MAAGDSRKNHSKVTSHIRRILLAMNRKIPTVLSVHVLHVASAQFLVYTVL